MAKRAQAKKSARRPSRKSARKPRKQTRKANTKKRSPRSSAKRQRSARGGSAKRQSSAGRTGRPSRRRKPPRPAARSKPARLNRPRRTLEEVLPTPPSSLNMNRHGSAARTGRAELEDSILEHTGMTPAITGGDVDADWEQAYFTGDEAPGGDNPTPDQDRVDDIGRAIGIEYADNEELKGADKVIERDKHRWELDPASAEDYPDHDED